MSLKSGVPCEERGAARAPFFLIVPPLSCESFQFAILPRISCHFFRLGPSNFSGLFLFFILRIRMVFDH